jgi:uncharacterized Fe-S cluster protein YjdI
VTSCEVFKNKFLFTSKINYNRHMKTKEYTNGEITILWKPEKCIHSGICVKTLPQVYKPKEKPWITIENAASDELIKQIATCPSGALSIKSDQ